jgi:hypothetical protein
MRNGGDRSPGGRALTRPFVLLVAAAWLAAALLLYWLEPGLGATYLVATGWIAAAGLLVWALVRWPPFRRTIAPRRRDGAPPGPQPRA